MISIPKWLYWIISICTTIALILVGTAFFTEPQFTSDLLLLAGMSLLSAYIVTSFWYVKSLFNVHYGVSEILKKFGKITYKKIPYSKVEGASLELAVAYRYNIPFRDQHKKEKAVLVLYQSNMSFVSCVCSDSCYPIGNSHCVRTNVLCCDFFNMESLHALFDKTDVDIYITEQILSLYKDNIMELIKHNPKRFIVAFYDSIDGKEKKLSYDLFSTKIEGDYLY